MIDHATFSALHLSRIFPAEHLQAYRFYREVTSKSGFDLEYMGGQWDEELIDGVKFLYPACDGNRLAQIELWGSGCVTADAVRDAPETLSASLVPTWAANINRVLEVLELSVRLGSDEGAVRSLAAGRVLSSKFPDAWYQVYPVVAKGTLQSLCFACRAPDIYHMEAVVHSGEGLLKLIVRRPDLVRLNDREGGYDMCFAGLYDEGT